MRDGRNSLTGMPSRHYASPRSRGATQRTFKEGKRRNETKNSVSYHIASNKGTSDKAAVPGGVGVRNNGVHTNSRDGDGVDEAQDVQIEAVSFVLFQLSVVATGAQQHLL